MFGDASKSRLNQFILIGSLLGFSWLGLQVVHELGHVLGAWLTGAEVRDVALHPQTFSRTDLGFNPHPNLVVWAGPVVGVLVPVILYLVAQTLRWPGVYLFRFFAGFCLVANGVYIGAGWVVAGGADAVIMIVNGSPRWTLVLFGLLTIPTGLRCWHRQGRHFGFAGAGGKVAIGATITSSLLFVGLAVLELLFGHK
jgi:hypothetical protein